MDLLKQKGVIKNGNGWIDCDGEQVILKVFYINIAVTSIKTPIIVYILRSVVVNLMISHRLNMNFLGNC